MPVTRTLNPLPFSDLLNGSKILCGNSSTILGRGFVWRRQAGRALTTATTPEELRDLIALQLMRMRMMMSLQTNLHACPNAHGSFSVSANEPSALAS
jgi:hypothetical protein